MTQYGYFDPKKADERGFFIYKTPDNREVMVTIVLDEKDLGKTGYTKKECVGVVTDHVSSHFTPQNPPPRWEDFY